MPEAVSEPAPEGEQAFFQVRLGWGAAGLGRLARSEIIVLVDVLGLSAAAERAAGGGDDLALASAMSAEDAVAVARLGSRGLAASGDAASGVAAFELAASGADPSRPGSSGAMVLAGCLRNAAAVARAVLAEQTRLAGRAAVSVIPLGASEWTHADVRMRVTDLLGAGAIVAALGDVGIDHTSPEAAVAGEGFRALRRAVRHMLLAATETQQLIADGEPSVRTGTPGAQGGESIHDAIAYASEVDAGDVVPVLHGDAFVPLTTASWPLAGQPA